MSIKLIYDIEFQTRVFHLTKWMHALYGLELNHVNQEVQGSASVQCQIVPSQGKAQGAIDFSGSGLER